MKPTSSLALEDTDIRRSLTLKCSDDRGVGGSSAVVVATRKVTIGGSATRALIEISFHDNRRKRGSRKREG